MCGCLLHGHTGDLCHNLHMCPDWDVKETNNEKNADILMGASLHRESSPKVPSHTFAYFHN